MPASITIDELLIYSNEERAKWRDFFLQHPDALAAPVQREGQFTSVGRLLYHIFLAESWHAQRLLGEEPKVPETEPAQDNPTVLFEYGRLERESLMSFVAKTEGPMLTVRQFGPPERQLKMSDRKTLFFLILHEIRHSAQIATAVRNAGFEPPGQHDLFFSAALE